MTEITQAVKDIQYVLDVYPFTDIHTNEGQELVFKRYLYTDLAKVEVSYYHAANSVVIYLGPRDSQFGTASNDHVLWNGDLEGIPEDGDLLDLVRFNMHWVNPAGGE